MSQGAGRDRGGSRVSPRRGPSASSKNTLMAGRLAALQVEEDAAGVDVMMGDSHEAMRSALPVGVRWVSDMMTSLFLQRRTNKLGDAQVATGYLLLLLQSVRMAIALIKPFLLENNSSDAFLLLAGALWKLMQYSVQVTMWHVLPSNWILLMLSHLTTRTEWNTSHLHDMSLLVQEHQGDRRARAVKAASVFRLVLIVAVLLNMSTLTYLLVVWYMGSSPSMATTTVYFWPFARDAVGLVLAVVDLLLSLHDTFVWYVPLVVPMLFVGELLHRFAEVHTAVSTWSSLTQERVWWLSRVHAGIAGEIKWFTSYFSWLFGLRAVYGFMLVSLISFQLVAAPVPDQTVVASAVWWVCNSLLLMLFELGPMGRLHSDSMVLSEEMANIAYVGIRDSDLRSYVMASYINSHSQAARKREHEQARVRLRFVEDDAESSDGPSHDDKASASDDVESSAADLMSQSVVEFRKMEAMTLRKEVWEIGVLPTEASVGQLVDMIKARSIGVKLFGALTVTTRLLSQIVSIGATVLLFIYSNRATS